MHVRSGFVVPVSVVLFGVGTARAATPTTCSVSAAYVMTVTVNGVDTYIEANPGGILVNGVFCGDEQLIESINVTGGKLADRVTLAGTFAPGRTYEPDFDEIEITVALGGGNDWLSFSLSLGYDFIGGIGSQVVMNDDADTDDVTVAADVESVAVFTADGDDQILFGQWTGAAKLYLHGGYGADHIEGSAGADQLYGDDGDDVIGGWGGNDTLYDGPGNDQLVGGDGNDRFEVWGVGSGADHVYGGAGSDTVAYTFRTTAVSVSTSNGLCDDGEAGEQDCVDPDVEKVVGGNGNDVIIGGTSGNTLTGGPGDDSLYGGGGVDTLYGGDGADHLVGDAGGDKIYGDAGDDTLEGGSGPDTLRGGDGSDVLDGGSGADAYFGEGGDDFLYNDDGVAETIDCGDGIDDPELDAGATDTFIACELI